MRKFIVSAALLASTIAAAAPAAAQWAQPVPRGYAYGYQDNYGQVRRLEVRVAQLRRQIERLDRRRILSNREARQLDQDARELQRRIAYSVRGGFSGRERYEIERRIVRLEQRIQYEARDGNRYGNDQRGFDYRDDDRDGRDDRREYRQWQDRRDRDDD